MNNYLRHWEHNSERPPHKTPWSVKNTDKLSWKSMERRMQFFFHLNVIFRNVTLFSQGIRYVVTFSSVTILRAHSFTRTILLLKCRRRYLTSYVSSNSNSVFLLQRLECWSWKTCWFSSRKKIKNTACYRWIRRSVVFVYVFWFFPAYSVENYIWFPAHPSCFCVGPGDKAQEFDGARGCNWPKGHFSCEHQSAGTWDVRDSLWIPWGKDKVSSLLWSTANMFTVQRRTSSKHNKRSLFDVHSKRFNNNCVLWFSGGWR